MMGFFRVIDGCENLSIFWTLHPIESHLFAKGNGVVEAHNSEGSDWFITRALVKPEDCRKMGIGSHMLKLLFDEVKKKHGTRILVTPGGYDNNRKEQFNFYKKEI